MIHFNWIQYILSVLAHKMFLPSLSFRVSRLRRSNLIFPISAVTGMAVHIFIKKKTKKQCTQQIAHCIPGSQTMMLILSVIACCVFVVAVLQGKERLCVSRCCCWSSCCLRCSNRWHTLQPRGGLLFLESSPNLESGMSVYEHKVEVFFC